jgi:hypothetical protein
VGYSDKERDYLIQSGHAEFFGVFAFYIGDMYVGGGDVDEASYGCANCESNCGPYTDKRTHI